jgi:hypothetical protein
MNCTAPTFIARAEALGKLAVGGGNETSEGGDGMDAFPGPLRDTAYRDPFPARDDPQCTTAFPGQSTHLSSEDERENVKGNHRHTQESAGVTGRKHF